MKKEMVTKNNRPERMPITRRSSFFTPWFDDFFEPTRWFDDFLPKNLSPMYGENRFFAPAMDIDETSEEYIVSADLPGVKREDISIECSGNQLCISAERKAESVEGRKTDRRERYYGSYQRSFTLPTGVNMDKIEASYEGGVLTVQIPKGEQARSRRIEIGKSKGRDSSFSKDEAEKRESSH